MRFELVEQILADFGDAPPAPVAMSAAEAFMQTWSYRIEPARASKYVEGMAPLSVPVAARSPWAGRVLSGLGGVSAGRIEILRARIDLQMGRTDSAADRFRALAENTSDPSSRQALWWLHDEAKYLGHREF
jgi:hypothetical protein